MKRRPRAVVTGGAGFLGSHLCERLVVEGYDVVCLDNFVTGTPANVEHLGELGPFRLVRADVTEPLRLRGDVDAVLHFASPASPVDYLRLPVATLRVGAVGTLAMLDLAREKRARFVLASTSESYGDPQVHPQPETYWGHVNPVGPRSVYDEGKRFAEAATAAYRRAHGVDTGIVRIFNTYGSRMRAEDGRAVPTFVRQALAGEPLAVSGDGSQTRSLCYVTDLVDGVLRLLRSGLGGPVNIGNPHELTVLALAELIRDLVGTTSPIRYVPRPEDDPTVRRPDITLAAQALGWEPRVRVEDGLRHTIEWFRRGLDQQAAATRLPLASRGAGVTVQPATAVPALRAPPPAWSRRRIGALR